MTLPTYLVVEDEPELRELEVLWGGDELKFAQRYHEQFRQQRKRQGSPNYLETIELYVRLKGDLGLETLLRLVLVQLEQRGATEPESVYHEPRHALNELLVLLTSSARPRHTRRTRR